LFSSPQDWQKNLPLYGVYPPAENLLMHLTGISIDKNGKRTDAEGGLTAVFQKAFKDVYENAKKSDFKNLALFGEKSKVLQCLEEYDGKYSLVKFSENVTKEEKEKGECGILWKGFFSCQLFGYNVLNHKGLEEKVEKVAKCEHTGRKGTEELVRVCKVLLSKDFARKILSDSFADAFLQHKKDACSYVNVWFYRPKREPIFCFYIAYRQYISDRFDVLFCFDYNIRECCFESSEIRVSRWFEVGTFCLQFFEKRDPYSEGLKEQPYHGTEALKYALRKLEANKRTDALLRKKKRQIKPMEYRKKLKGRPQNKSRNSRSVKRKIRR